MQGIDTTNISVQMMQQAGAKFACLYFGYFAGYDITKVGTKQGKVTTPSEVAALSKSGYYVVTNYEWFTTRPLDGYDAGIWDANMCSKIHQVCGGPPNAVFYFSYDYQTDGSNILEVQYIQGVAKVIGLNRTGIYGPYAIVKNYFDNGLIKYAWQTYAWSTDNTGTFWDPRVNIEQYLNTAAAYDFDRSMTTDFGQWTLDSPVSTKEDNDVHIELVPDGPAHTFVFKPGSTPQILVGCDFGNAMLRFAIYDTRLGHWSVYDDVPVNSARGVTIPPFTIPSFISMGSVLAHSADNPNMPISVDIYQ